MIVYNFKEFFENSFDKMKQWGMKWRKSAQITFTGFELDRKDSDYQSDTYPFAVRAIIHYMTINGKLDKIKCLRELFITENLAENRNLTLGMESNIEFDIAPKITGIVTRTKYRSESYTGMIVDFVIKSRKLSMCDLRTFVETCIIQLNDHMLMEGDRRHYFFSYLGAGPVTLKGGDDDDDYSRRRRNNNRGGKSSARFDECIFTTNRTFNNIFFEQKETLYRKIDFFMKNKAWYDERGIPYTLGLLFHGTPGCGKTSTIKAIAQMTGRHIVEVHLSKIKSAREFIDIFHNENIMGKIIPMNRRLYILEDIDCMGQIVQRREKTKTEGQSSSSRSSSSNGDHESEDDEQTMKFMKIASAISKMNNFSSSSSSTPVTILRNDDEMTLSVLLNAMDGVLEMTGRMLIMTTNHPEKLDPALIRPGRIDMKVHFKKCIPQILKQMIEHFYQITLTEDEVAGLDTINEKWTPAEVSEILIRNSDDYRVTFNDLIHTVPSTF
jgi:hypothetical protein